MNNPIKYIALYLVKSEVKCKSRFTYGGDVKIGVTSSFEKRLSAIQTGNPNKLCMESICFFETAEKAYKAEKTIHKLLKDFRKEGEWFSNSCLDMLQECLKTLTTEWLKDQNPLYPDDVDFELTEIPKNDEQ